MIIDADPSEALRSVALGLFDAIEAHPWVGAQLSLHPLRPATLDIYECIGRLLDALAVAEQARFDAAGALMNYILGVAGRNAVRNGPDREAALAAVAAQWAQLDPDKYPFVRQAAMQLREHDDREQFLAGIDIFLAGVATLR